MLGLRAHGWISAGLFAAVIGIAVLGNVLEAMGVAPPPPAFRLPFLTAYLILVLAFVLSLVPVIVKTVLGAQDAGAVAVLVRHQDRIVWALWLLILLGLAIALPAMIANGFFAP